MKKSVSHLNEITLEYTKRLFSNTGVKCSSDAANVAREIYGNTNSKIDLKEYFFVICLNRANEVIGYHKVSEGGVSQTVVDARIIFATAVKCLATGIILLHNHPSGNLKPSQQDRDMTRKIADAGKLLDVALIDHLIITSESYYSFIDNGDA